MTPTEYVKQAVRTKSARFHVPESTLPIDLTCGSLTVDVLHAIAGISTEAGELLDVVKKAMFYGKKVDYVNLNEEMGDVLWYIAIYCQARDVSIETLMQLNIDKLRVRFPQWFTEQQAEFRDLAAERAVLEGKPSEWDAEATQMLK